MEMGADAKAGVSHRLGQGCMVKRTRQIEGAGDLQHKCKRTMPILAKSCTLSWLLLKADEDALPSGT
jgi:hypothetical protein